MAHGRASRDGFHPEQCTQPEHPPHVHTMRPDRERTLERVGIHVHLVREPTISYLAHPAYRWRKVRADERTRTADLTSLRVCCRTCDPVLISPAIWLIYAVFALSGNDYCPLRSALYQPGCGKLRLMTILRPYRVHHPSEVPNVSS
jgi:hypothetical protein